MNSKKPSVDTRVLVKVYVKSLGLTRYVSLPPGLDRIEILNRFSMRMSALGSSKHDSSLSAITPEILRIRDVIRLADPSDFVVTVLPRPPIDNIQPRQWGSVVKRLNQEELKKWASKQGPQP